MNRVLRSPLFVAIGAVGISVILLMLGSRASYPKELDTPYAPTVTLLCYGLNAPAALLTYPQVFNLLPYWRFAGFDSADYLFFAGVFVAWYGTAAFLRQPAGSTVVIRRVMSALVFVLGLYLAYLALFRVWHYPSNNPLGNKIEGVLFLSWSCFLIIYAGPLLMRSDRKSG